MLKNPHTPKSYAALDFLSFSFHQLIYVCIFVWNLHLIVVNFIVLLGTGVAADTAASRIMELSKKNRELMADLESERNKVRQLMKKMREMEKEVLYIALLW